MLTATINDTPYCVGPWAETYMGGNRPDQLGIWRKCPSRPDALRYVMEMVRRAAPLRYLFQAGYSEDDIEIVDDISEVADRLPLFVLENPDWAGVLSAAGVDVPALLRAARELRARVGRDPIFRKESVTGAIGAALKKLDLAWPKLEMSDDCAAAAPGASGEATVASDDEGFGPFRIPTGRSGPTRVQHNAPGTPTSVDGASPWSRPAKRLSSRGRNRRGTPSSR